MRLMGAHASRLKRDVNPAVLGRRKGGGFWAVLSMVAAFFTLAAFEGGGGGTVTATKPRTLQELYDERARVLAEIDGFLETAKQDGNRSLSDEEKVDHDEVVARYEALKAEIKQAEGSVQIDELHRSQQERLRLASVRFNTIGSAPASADRSLDELYWAYNEVVPAGEITRQGRFVPNRYGAVNEVEAMPVRDANDVVIEAPKLADFLPEHQKAIRQFQRVTSDMVLFGFMVSKEPRSSREAFLIARDHRLMKPRWDGVLRALDVDTAAEGKEFVPTGLGADVHEQVRASGRIAPLFATINIPTNPWEMPIEGADATAFLVAEPTSDTATKVTASTPGTKKVTFDAEIFGARTLWSRSLDADSAIAIMPFTRGKLVRAFRDAEEKAILDGDTAGAHQDTDVVAATDARKAWDGLRKIALAQTNTDAGNVLVTLGKLRAARKLMKKWGLNPAELALIVPVSVFYQMLDLDEVTTVDKLGASATILNGQLAAVDGSPIIVTEHGREDLNASGVNDGVTTNRTYGLIVNRGEWAMGQRMALDLEVDDSIYRETFQRVLIGFLREDFQRLADIATNEDTAVLRNISL